MKKPDNDTLRKSPGTGDCLVEQMRRLQDFIDFSPAAYLILDQEGHILDCNHTAQTFLKVSKPELIGRGFDQFTDVEHRDSLNGHLASLFAHKRPPVSLEICLTFCRQGRFWVLMDSMYDEINGQAVSRSILTDISPLKQSREKFMQSREHLDLAMEGANMGFWDRDLVTNRAVWSDQIYRLIGLDPKESPVTVETLYDFAHPDDLGPALDRLEKKLRAGPDFKDEFRIIRKDGQMRWIALAGRICNDAQGRPIRSAGIAFDITDHKMVEEKFKKLSEHLEEMVLQRTNELKLKTLSLEKEIDRRKTTEKRLMVQIAMRRFLSQRLVDLLEKERTAIGNTLHDQIGQAIAGIHMKVGQIKRDPRLQGANLDDALDDVLGLIQDTMRQIREMSHLLRPEILNRFGLTSAIVNLIADMKRYSNLTINFFSKRVPKNIDKNVELAVYRIVQEAMTNIFKHAHAKHVFISLFKRGPKLFLTVEDDGIGFDFSAHLRESGHHRALGLIIMRERANHVDGEVFVESHPSKGTQVQAVIPLSGNRKELSKKPV